MAASYLGWQPMAWFRGTQVGRGGLFDAETRFGSPCARTDAQKRIGWLVESWRFQVGRCGGPIDAGSSATRVTRAIEDPDRQQIALVGGGLAEAARKKTV